MERLTTQHLNRMTLADAAQWSGLTVAALRIGLLRLEAEDVIVRYLDERGRTLVDLAGAPKPDPNVPAPVRLLPMWDSVLLAFADRTRIISDEHRARVIARNGDVAPTFLVDGRVAGMWWGRVDGDGQGIVELEPFAPLSDEVRLALMAEAERLAAWIAPHERGVFGRYRGSTARRSL